MSVLGGLYGPDSPGFEAWVAASDIRYGVTARLARYYGHTRHVLLGSLAAPSVADRLVAVIDGEVRP